MNTFSLSVGKSFFYFKINENDEVLKPIIQILNNTIKISESLFLKKEMTFINLLSNKVEEMLYSKNKEVLVEKTFEFSEYIFSIKRKYSSN